MRSSSAAGYPGLRKGAVGVNYKGLPALFIFPQGLGEGFPPDNQSGVAELSLMERRKVLAMPARQVLNGLRHIKYSPFLR